jgi:hypothetical protein
VTSAVATTTFTFRLMVATLFGNWTPFGQLTVPRRRPGSVRPWRRRTRGWRGCAGACQQRCLMGAGLCQQLFLSGGRV